MGLAICGWVHGVEWLTAFSFRALGLTGFHWFSACGCQILRWYLGGFKCLRFRVQKRLVGLGMKGHGLGVAVLALRLKLRVSFFKQSERKF